MNEPVTSWPSLSNAMSSIRIWPTPIATPPTICPFSSSGFITVPTSSTTLYFTTSTTPVSGSTSTSQMCTPFGKFSTSAL